MSSILHKVARVYLIIMPEKYRYKRTEIIDWGDWKHRAHSKYSGTLDDVSSGTQKKRNGISAFGYEKKSPQKIENTESKAMKMKIRTEHGTTQTWKRAHFINALRMFAKNGRLIDTSAMMNQNTCRLGRMHFDYVCMCVDMKCSVTCLC